MMRVMGIARAILALAVNFFIFYFLLGFWAGFLFTAGIAIYTVCGEYLSLVKDGAVNMNNVDPCSKAKLNRVQALLSDEAKKVGVDITRLKLHVTPDDRCNCFAYGTTHVSVTKGALSATDDLTLAGLLAHEVSHTMMADALFYRIIWSDVTVMIFALIAASVFSTGALWILFALLSLCGITGGIFSIFVCRGINKGIRSVFSGFQHVVLFIYQICFGLISRACEYRADRFAADLGFGSQLIFFLNRFSNDDRPRRIQDLLYGSHPAAQKRIQKIQRYSQTTLQDTR